MIRLLLPWTILAVSGACTPGAVSSTSSSSSSGAPSSSSFAAPPGSSSVPGPSSGAASSTTGGSTCNGETCEGCCEPSGRCRTGRDNRACGVAGEACLDCAAQGQFCRDGSCAAPRCGDAEVTPGEDCEPGNLMGVTCGSLGFREGALACGPGCRFDTSACVPACSAADPATCEGLLARRCDGGRLVTEECLTPMVCLVSSDASWSGCYPVGTLTCDHAAFVERCDTDTRVWCSHDFEVHEDCGDLATCVMDGARAVCHDDARPLCNPETDRNHCADNQACRCEGYSGSTLHEWGCQPCRNLYNPEEHLVCTDGVRGGTDVACVVQGTEACAPESASVTSCQGDLMVQCDPVLGWERLVRDCARDGLVCGQGNGDALCVLPGTGPCGAESFRCDAQDRAWTCNGGNPLNWEVVDDCPGRGRTCRVFAGTPACVPADYTSCTVGYADHCNGDTVTECVFPGHQHDGYVEETDCVDPNPDCVENTVPGYLGPVCTFVGAEFCNPTEHINDFYACHDGTTMLGCGDGGMEVLQRCAAGRWCEAGGTGMMAYANCVRTPGD